VSLSGDQLKALARQGAAQRYEELQAELAALKATFPELGRKGGRSAGTAAAPRRRRTMNAAQRKEVSERMSKYWAARRAEKTGADGASPAKGKRRRKSAKKAAE
jgi:hypothetical protein